MTMQSWHTSKLLYIIFVALSTCAYAQTTGLNNTGLNETIPTMDGTTVEILRESSEGFYNDPVRQNITYFAYDGLAIVEGDVIAGTVANIQATSAVRRGDMHKRSFSIFPTDGTRKWPGAEVLYKYESQAAKELHEDTFELAIKLWKDKLPWLKFTEILPPNPTLETGGGPITIETNRDTRNTGYSASPLGRSIDGSGKFFKDNNRFILSDCGAPAGGKVRASCASHYAHEIGHTLGLDHEHQRPDRDGYIQVNCENILDMNDKGVIVKAKCDTGACAGWGCALSKEKPGAFYFPGSYDLSSIMHYEPFSFSREPFVLKTLQGANGLPDPKRSQQPTLTDAMHLCHVYFDECTSVCGDGLLSPASGETCDLGGDNGKDGSGCSIDCKVVTPPTSVCGNGIVEEGEACDEGALNGDPNGSCTTSCQPALKCPIQTCDPTPGKNLCDITTSCIPLDAAVGANKGKHRCACRHGFRAYGFDPGDASKQVRVAEGDWPGQGNRVFVDPGVACSQVCAKWTLGGDDCVYAQARPECF